ncbi:hypothetical protein TRFO_34126 [Tritrichomonas foetus]|uniref:Serine/threonine-protein phosphatase n=1 Tax=Tritrichomonas foetus TaxID=1144522 RepID=A0A1J4JJS4_9EUKA|nr:hypothetical protein TRFO_34126 [Tritrichomonas foetus]|eukprot:OHS99406.1 hypothetical protein TRFO_34126 [Tritrichomonas foetus]
MKTITLKKFHFLRRKLMSLVAEHIFSAFWPLIQASEDEIKTIGDIIPLPRFEASDIVSLCQSTLSVVQNTDHILTLEPPIYIIGDIHGDIHDLLRIFSRIPEFPNVKVLLLGDYIDRGGYSTEVVILLFALVSAYPNNFYLLRGNHEFPNVLNINILEMELSSMYGNSPLYHTIHKVFTYLPIAAVIGNQNITPGSFNDSSSIAKSFCPLNNKYDQNNSNLQNINNCSFLVPCISDAEQNSPIPLHTSPSFNFNCSRVNPQQDSFLSSFIKNGNAQKPQSLDVRSRSRLDLHFELNSNHQNSQPKHHSDSFLCPIRCDHINNHGTSIIAESNVDFINNPCKCSGNDEKKENYNIHHNICNNDDKEDEEKMKKNNHKTKSNNEDNSDETDDQKTTNNDEDDEYEKNMRSKLEGFRGSYLCVHGGISELLTSPLDLLSLKYPIRNYQDKLLQDILWSDPSPDMDGFSQSVRGCGSNFGGDVVKKFLKDNKFKMLIRAHQCVINGLSLCSNCVLTVFSSSRYHHENNKGAFIRINEDETISTEILSPFSPMKRQNANFTNVPKQKSKSRKVARSLLSARTIVSPSSSLLIKKPRARISKKSANGKIMKPEFNSTGKIIEMHLQ